MSSIKCSKLLIIESRWWVYGCLMQNSSKYSVFEIFHNETLGRKTLWPIVADEIITPTLCSLPLLKLDLHTLCYVTSQGSPPNKGESVDFLVPRASDLVTWLTSVDGALVNLTWAEAPNVLVGFRASWASAIAMERKQDPCSCYYQN